MLQDAAELAAAHHRQVAVLALQVSLQLTWELLHLFSTECHSRRGFAAWQLVMITVALQGLEHRRASCIATQQC